MLNVKRDISRRYDCLSVCLHRDYRYPKNIKVLICKTDMIVPCSLSGLLQILTCFNFMLINKYYKSLNPNNTKSSDLQA